MRFEVLSEGLFNVGSIHDFGVNEVADVFKNEIDFTDGGTLDEVLYNLALHAAHI
jgi:hypothetical protein